MKRLVVVVLMGCGGGGAQMTTGTGGGGEAAGAGGGSGGGSSSSALLSVSECETDMQRFADAQCTDASQWAMAKTMVCPKIPNLTSAPCEAALKRAKTCHAQFQQAQVSCVFGYTDSSDPCALDVMLGVSCVASVNSAQCMGTPCMYNSDCGTGYSCNDKTQRCVRSSGWCLGLPCRYSADCPTGFTCNDALEACVRN